MTRRRLLILSAGMVAVTAALVVPSLLARPEPAAAPDDTSRVTWTLAFDRAGARIGPDSTWYVRTARGDDVHVTSGWLVTYGLTLVPCAGSGRGVGVLDRLLGSGFATAGHSGPRDPSAIAAPIAETLVPARDRSLETRMTGGHDYCAAHYLVARGGPRVQGDGAPLRLSLQLQGTRTRPGGVATPFRIESRVAYGRFFELAHEDHQPAVAASGDDLILTVARPLARLFDGVDFETMDDTEVARTVLRNVVDAAVITAGARVTVTP